jgi:hypothetical protein
MRRHWAGVFLAMGAMSLLSACAANDDAFPNDQARIIEALDAENIDVEVQADQDTEDSGTHVTVTCVTDCTEGADLTAVVRHVWQEYPHHIQTLTVETSGLDTVDFSRNQLVEALGSPAFRAEDSAPPFLKGYLAAFALGGLGAAALFTWAAVLSRAGAKRVRSADPPPYPRADTGPPTTWPTNTTQWQQPTWPPYAPPQQIRPTPPDWNPPVAGMSAHSLERRLNRNAVVLGAMVVLIVISVALIPIFMGLGLEQASQIQAIAITPITTVLGLVQTHLTLLTLRQSDQRR